MKMRENDADNPTPKDTGGAVRGRRRPRQSEAAQERGVDLVQVYRNPGEPCIQKLADYEGKKFVLIQKDDVEFDETADERRSNPQTNIG